MPSIGSFRRDVGRARVGRAIGKAPSAERAGTDVFDVQEPPPPVFVDAGGARGRRLRRLAYTVCLLILLLMAGFWVSQLAGQARPPVWVGR